MPSKSANSELAAGEFDFVVVANRLPVDIQYEDDGSFTWQQSPGGLVTAMEPVMRANHGAWVGWTGGTGETPEPFDIEGMRLAPVPLNEEEVADYYEGFSNATLWPLYHDVIVPAEFHRHWWVTYQAINERFAQAAAKQAAPNAMVWVHDYQLQLVPQYLRKLRPDVKIGYFHHIPFPPVELFSQLPWRTQIVSGLLGADVVGFQRQGDARNFLRSVRRLTGQPTRGSTVHLNERYTDTPRQVRASAFPISIDSGAFDSRARELKVQERAREIRAELGNPEIIFLGVDRLDYTKGILHRLKSYGELLTEGSLAPPQSVLVQVASPSREGVEQYQVLRDEVEVTVGRLNGDYGELGNPAVHYLHHSYDHDEMTALYLAADVMLVTSLRDGMNLVAKEYIASRIDENGVLILSEFTGAADELGHAVMINPHDYEGTKEAMMRASQMPAREARRRMRALRRRVMENDVVKWAERFIDTLENHPRPAVKNQNSAS
ncbi:MAG TPA: trehalose-6-phosphate synthase [Actinomycetales bacterium]|nr:trehalose-6-phosphate synthase [Actinomycetales bacterium]